MLSSMIGRACNLRSRDQRGPPLHHDFRALELRHEPDELTNDPARASQSRWVDNIVAIDGDVMIGATVTGTSAPPTYTLAVSKAGSGTGTVSGLGISCGVDCAELVPGGRA